MHLTDNATIPFAHGLRTFGYGQDGWMDGAPHRTIMSSTGISSDVQQKNTPWGANPNSNTCGCIYIDGCIFFWLCQSFA
ncbi:hypothetical protein NXS19_003737 [Fusarium pseudograminearum]|nr:hypothetical protein NXS19_003737 [Fusarium pseudograminearum]